MNVFHKYEQPYWLCSTNGSVCDIGQTSTNQFFLSQEERYLQVLYCKAFSLLLWFKYVILQFCYNSDLFFSVLASGNCFPSEFSQDWTDVIRSKGVILEGEKDF